jgi:preprotein translocase subunit SecY
LPTAVLNDEATVTDATTATTLTGGGTLTIPVWYNGTTKLGGGSGMGLIIAQPLSQKLSSGIVFYQNTIYSDFSFCW